MRNMPWYEDPNERFYPLTQLQAATLAAAAECEWGRRTDNDPHDAKRFLAAAQVIRKLDQAATETEVTIETAHTTVKATMGGFVGIKDMLFDGVKRLAVRSSASTGPAEGLGVLYLDKDECETVARLLAPHLFPEAR